MAAATAAVGEAPGRAGKAVARARAAAESISSQQNVLCMRVYSTSRSSPKNGNTSSLWLIRTEDSRVAARAAVKVARAAAANEAAVVAEGRVVVDNEAATSYWSRRMAMATGTRAPTWRAREPGVRVV